MGDKHLKQAIQSIERFVEQRFPEASVVLLCGSWAHHIAHEDSDLDLFIVDASMKALLFQGLIFEDWVIEVCALSPERITSFFAGSAHHRSAPVPHQVLDALVIRGEPSAAEQIKAMAQQVLTKGPAALNETEILDLRWRLTALLNDLAHVTPAEVPALAAQCHTQLALAAIDCAGGWRGEHKTLRRALMVTAPDLVEPLDTGLIAACTGNCQPLLAVGRQILATLGGRQRTYLEWY